MGETKVTTKEVKTIADKMFSVNDLLQEVKDILASDNYDAFISIPMSVTMPVADVVELARVCRKKPEAKSFLGDYDISFTIYGCTFKATCFEEKELQYWLENGVFMKGEKK